MIDPFLTGLIAGAVLGFAPISLRLLQLAALVGLGLLAWLAVHQGLDGLQGTISHVLSDVLLPNARLTGGAVLGAILGASLARMVRMKTHS